MSPPPYTGGAGGRASTILWGCPLPPPSPPLDPAEYGAMKVFQHEKQLRTAGGLTVTDITEDVQTAVRESGITEGIACVYSPHTTCCVRVNELEEGFLEDFTSLL